MTENSEIAKTIATDLSTILKPAGFRKRANSFNRLARDGLVHHVSIQLGAYDPSGVHAIPGLLPDLYGHYCVNLGVHVPEMNRSSSPRSSWINDYDCQLQWRLGDFMPGGFDRWWDLRDRLSVEEVRSQLETSGIPQLDKFQDSEDVLGAYFREGPESFGSLANNSVALDVADLLIAKSRRAEAEQVLARYVRWNREQESPGAVGHRSYLREYLRRRDFGDLASSVE